MTGPLFEQPRYPSYLNHSLAASRNPTLLPLFVSDQVDQQRVDGGSIHVADAGRRTGLLAGWGCLSACLFASLLLVLAHFDAVELPGCGAVSDCARAAESRWGTLPGTDWPLAFVGVAYFQALLAAFIYGGVRLPRLLRATVGIGAVVSVLLIVVMLIEGYVCGYCLSVHVLNIAFAVG